MKKLFGFILVLTFLAPSQSFAATNVFCSQLLSSGTNTEIKKADKNFSLTKTRLSSDLARDEKLAKAKSVSTAKTIKSKTDKESVAYIKLKPPYNTPSDSTQTQALSTYNATTEQLMIDRAAANATAIAEYDADLDKIIKQRKDEMDILMANYQKALSDALTKAKYDCLDKTGSASAETTYNTSIMDAVNTFKSDGNKATKTFVDSIVASIVTRNTAVTEAGSTFKSEIAKAKKTLGLAWPLKIVKMFPADNATSVPKTTKLIITFDQVVYGGKGVISLIYDTPQTKHSSGGMAIVEWHGDNHVENALNKSVRGGCGTGGTCNIVRGSGTKTITLGIDSYHVEPNKDYYFLIEPDAFINSLGNEFEGISDPTIWNFKTK